jgi:hypothetical protein
VGFLFRDEATSALWAVPGIEIHDCLVVWDNAATGIFQIGNHQRGNKEKKIEQ